MEITIGRVSKYCSMTISDGNATIDCGLLSATEIEEMASKLRDAASQLDGREFVEKE